MRHTETPVKVLKITGLGRSGSTILDVVLWVGRTDPHSIEGYPKLQSDFELKRRWPRLLYERRRPSARFRSYARLTRAFFESIRAVSGKPIIVDSATVPVRTFALGIVPGMDL